MSKVVKRNSKALHSVFVVCVELEIYNLICKKKKGGWNYLTECLCTDFHGNYIL